MRRTTIGLIALVIVVPMLVAAQRGGFGARQLGRDQYPNLPYDGQFTLVRIRYDSYRSWRADYPTMERNLATMLEALTSIRVHRDGSQVFSLDDPELLKYPVAYLTEPGYWHPSDAEVLGLRQYLAKGGFLIVDDFHFANEWAVFENAMRRVLPDARIDRLDVTHPVFNAFFEITPLRVPYPAGYGEMGLHGEFYGIHEDNDLDEAPVGRDQLQHGHQARRRWR
ncbi:MAG: DUF4159 domain-containing protein [Vicinamibacterales bacterium]